jgi:outer membrane receptor for ferrienterochelin and colicin
MKKLLLLSFILSFEVIAQDEIQEMTVAAPRIKNSVESLLELRKNKNEVSDVLGQEAMARSGDSDAASSLRRVTGLTLVSGKYVYVRGLGERYSSVLLNGSQVPSPEPTRRVVPLDLFTVYII